ncbi:hypothetical protein HUG15_19835 [Salicibibacter cibarius]|uniref:Uncharacterized protein n=1 Tax=Salicibibacter cibarius TaxID=2743000 RepID=A0A7T7CD44_9BACI|nr:hypothetical protein [Salicibibacter cibarius]QQK77612.1 hypothetical protein HUG15_19835 [Salicibibacter cibarius]
MDNELKEMLLSLKTQIDEGFNQPNKRFDEIEKRLDRIELNNHEDVMGMINNIDKKVDRLN